MTAASPLSDCRAAQEVLHKATPLVVHYLPGRSQRLVVSFAGVGKQHFGAPPIEFFDTASNAGENHVLFISDPTRSWLNADGMDQAIVDLVTELKDRVGATEVVALGNSMGGFAAIRLAELMPINTVIAFAPQFSIDPKRVPEETRWERFQSKISNWSHPDIGTLTAPNTIYFIFHGSAPQEAVHWSRFPQDPRLNHFILVNVGHGVAKELRKRQVLQHVVQASIQGRSRRVRELMEAKFVQSKIKVFRREFYEQDRLSQYPLYTRPDRLVGASIGPDVPSDFSTNANLAQR